MTKLYLTEDGSHSLFSEKFGVTYHSKYGAIQETQHVFIDAALRYKAVLQKELTVLDIGFGTGLNAFMTFLEAEKRGLSIKYKAVEAFPIPLEQVKTFNYAEQCKAEEARETFLSMHEMPWGRRLQLSPSFSFKKIQKQFQELNYTEGYDIIYFDAFAPNAQPELWEADLLAKMFQALKPEGVLTTYCAKGVVKRTMKAVGFEIEGIKGPPGKREMTRATKPRINEKLIMKVV